MKAAVERSGVFFLQSFPQRLMPGNLAIKKLLDERAIGKISHVRKRHGHPFGLKGLEQDMPWIVDPGSAGGGAYLDEGVHQTDILQWYFGMPLSVMAQTTGRLGNVETSGAALYRFEGNILAVHEAAWNWHAGGPTTEIYGEEGTIIQSYTDCASNSQGNFCPHLALYRAKTGSWEEIPVTYDFSMTHTLFPTIFVDLLTGETNELPATIDDGMKALEMALAAYQSARTGQLITFPLTEKKISV
jgi:predicted dehydrogenase